MNVNETVRDRHTVTVSSVSIIQLIQHGKRVFPKHFSKDRYTTHTIQTDIHYLYFRLNIHLWGLIILFCACQSVSNRKAHIKKKTSRASIKSKTGSHNKASRLIQVKSKMMSLSFQGNDSGLPFTTVNWCVMSADVFVNFSVLGNVF